ncbi:MAG: response regulator [candidate division NC10 bacterium]|nr:response regulator [candidate division NC10 bacterium]
MEANAHKSARILVVDDRPQNLELIQAYLEGEGYEVITARNGQEALAKASEEEPDLILLDVIMPDLSGYQVCERLKGNEKIASIPVIIVTALHQMEEKQKALEAGADDFLSKPVDRIELLTRVGSLLKVRHLGKELDRTLAYLHELDAARHQEAARPRMATPPVEGLKPPVSGLALEGAHVLIIDDEKAIRDIYKDLLVSFGYQVSTAGNARDGLNKVRETPFDAILLDVMMPGMSGLDALASLKELAPHVPVIIITANPTSQNAITALRHGAFDFIVKGSKVEAIVHSVRRAVERYRLELRNTQLLQELKRKIDELLREKGEGI